MTAEVVSAPGVHRTVTAAEPLPLVFDSPHSGNTEAVEFGSALPTEVLRRAEDSYVDELFADVAGYGATLIAAAFPRAFIDVNRAPDDIDPDLLDGAWPEPLRPTVRSERGIGLIRRLVGPGDIIYQRPLSVADVLARLDDHYRPYHAHLERTLTGHRRRYGRVFHVNCHSMKSVGNATTPDGPTERVDIVIGDLNGRSCRSDFTRFVAGAFSSRGYSVALNDPYAGAFILERYGDPEGGTHSLQVEINRALYMDEETRRRHDGFERLRADLGAIAADIAGFVAATSSTGR